MPNLVKIYSVFVKLEAVKQSGPGFLAYPVADVDKLKTRLINECSVQFDRSIVDVAISQWRRRHMRLCPCTRGTYTSNINSDSFEPNSYTYLYFC